MWIRRFATGAAAALLTAVATPAGAATELQWWHAMGGELGQKLEKMANDFNASQSDYKVVPVFKGSYPEAMTAAIAAFRAKQNPALLQVFVVQPRQRMEVVLGRRQAFALRDLD